MQRFFLLMLISILVLPHPAEAQQQQRFALLIGNQGYHPSVGALRNPHNDIALVGAALGRQGFTVLPPLKDARRSQILGAVRDLVHRLNNAGPGAVGFVYYSGHGAAEKETGINYLIPVDVREPNTTAFWDESLKLDDVVRLLQGARSAAKFVVFDACRNELQMPERTSDKGLARIEEQRGMLIAYAAAPGRTASDGSGASGPYAAALASELATPGLDHLNLFHNVKEAVLKSTGGAQQPWTSDGLTSRVVLTAPAKPVPAATVVEPQPGAVVPPAAPSLDAAERAWDRVKDSRSVAVLEAYARQFAGTVYAVMATERIATLSREAVAQAATEAAERQRQERERLATLQRQEEARRKQEDEARRGVQAQGDVLEADRYFWGLGRAIDYGRAKQHAEKAAAAGRPEGSYALGLIHNIGGGVVVRNARVANDHFRFAIAGLRFRAARGEAIAMRMLGDAYTLGRGVDEDLSVGFQWKEKAAHANDMPAVFEVGEAYELAEGVSKNMARAREHYERAAHAGLPIAIVHLALLHEHGSGGLKKNAAQAAQLYRRAADLGEPLGMANFGNLIDQGLGGLRVDQKAARSWWERAARLGNSRAMRELARYIDISAGGFAFDASAAARWLLEALDRGDEDAKKDLTSRSEAKLWNTATLRALQQLLADAGHYTGAIDGNWGAGSVAAAEAYMNRRR